MTLQEKWGAKHELLLPYQIEKLFINGFPMFVLNVFEGHCSIAPRSLRYSFNHQFLETKTFKSQNVV